jgi:hypothetical protein
MPDHGQSAGSDPVINGSGGYFAEPGKLAPGEKGLGRAPCFGMNVRFHKRKRTLGIPVIRASVDTGGYPQAKDPPLF